MSSKNPGIELEQKVHESIQTISQKIKIFRETDITRIYGKIANGIDHLILINDKMICIQDKWEKRKPCIRDINHFTSAVDMICNKIDKELLLVLFISKKKFTKTGNNIFVENNKNIPSDIYVNIYDDDMDNLVSQTVLNIKNCLILNGCIERVQQIENIEIYNLYPHQQEVLTNYRNSNLKRGIVCHPTGTGKSISAINIIGEYWKNNPGKSVLWITQRKDVLKSQFENHDKMNIYINSNFIPDYHFFKYLPWYNTKCNIKKLNNELNKNKPVFLITNIDSILYNERYKSIIDNKFGLIILDECHSSGAELTYNMVYYFLEKWNNIHLVGFSATPLRREHKKLKRTLSIFGDGENINYFSRMSILDAIEKNIIVPPKFYWIDTVMEGNYILDGQEIHVIKYIEKILKESVTKKGIAWAKNIKRAKKWKYEIEKCQNDKKKFPELSKYKILITHSEQKKEDGDFIKQFLLIEKYCILICVGRCCEGFDDPGVDFGIDLDPVKKRGVILFIQKIGRTLRKKNMKQVGIMMETFSFVDENTKMQEIATLIANYYIEIVKYQCDNIENTLKYIKFEKTEKGYQIKRGDVIIPMKILSRTLKEMDWKNLSKYIKTIIQNSFYENGIGYETAKEIIKHNNIKTKSEYENFVLTDLRLPDDPECFYSGSFIGWIDYLSIPRDFYDLESCINKVDEILNENEIKINSLDLADMCYQLCKLDPMFPPNEMWVYYYKNEGIHNISEIIKIIDIDLLIL
jgi:superfamily II DNA or RNA helicase